MDKTIIALVSLAALIMLYETAKYLFKYLKSKDLPMTYDCLCRVMRLHDILEDRKPTHPKSQDTPSSRDFTKYTRDDTL